jgi:CBS domain-containing protein
MTVLEAGSRRLVITYPDEVLHEASSKMLRNNIGRLPVVERNDPRKVIGYLGRAWNYGRSPAALGGGACAGLPAGGQLY